MTGSLPPRYFEDLYAADPDPWRFATSDYERDKYATTLSTLPKEHYGSALEVGCSIGVLTRELATRCDALVAIDAAATPIEAARERCADRPGVRFARMTVPGEWPEGRFDLILLSEVVYYLDAGDVRRLARRVEASLAEGGDVLLIHWTGLTNYPLSGDEASKIFLGEVAGFTTLLRQERHEQFRLDLVGRR